MITDLPFEESPSFRNLRDGGLDARVLPAYYPSNMESNIPVWPERRDRVDASRNPWDPEKYPERYKLVEKLISQVDALETGGKKCSKSGSTERVSTTKDQTGKPSVESSTISQQEKSSKRPSLSEIPPITLRR